MWYPPSRDRMPSRYAPARWPHAQTANWRQPNPSRWRRRIENALWRKYAGTAAKTEAAMDDADNDITDCVHGCCGRPAPCVNERCNFTCHADDPQQSGHGDDE
jgi:hypothetical protein